MNIYHYGTRLCEVFLFLISVAGLQAACSPLETLEPTVVVKTLALPSSTPSPTVVPNTPTVSSSPTFTASPTATVTPTATPTPHPMSILALRQAVFPASEILIEETLENGPNYFRYYVSYRSDGLKIYALLTVPFGEMPVTGWPAIVFNHGYIPPDVYRTTERYIAYVDQLARSGYVVFRIDYRGHDRSEGEAIGAYGSPGYTVDVLNAVSALKASPLLFEMLQVSLNFFGISAIIRK